MKKRIAPTRFKRPKVGIKPRAVTKIRRTKAQAYTADWSAITARIRKRDGNKCRQCGSTSSLQVHHIVHVARGGLTINSNLMTLCKKCHERKH